MQATDQVALFSGASRSGGSRPIVGKILESEDLNDCYSTVLSFGTVNYDVGKT